MNIDLGVSMRLLAIGDVCGDIGCMHLKSVLPKIKQQYGIDVVIVNGENSADGNGITPNSAEFLLNIGADVITGGNHSLRRSEVLPFLEETQLVLRPDNLKNSEFGKGYTLVDFGSYQIAVINLAGTVYLERLGAENPFIWVDLLLERAKNDGAKIIIVDFHAEATSEKRAMGYYLDGKVSVVFGTHTHVQTSDCQVLPNGTGYITDLGMTGPKNSVLGVKTETIINRLRNNDQSKFFFADGECILNGCIFDIDIKTGKCTSTTLLTL